MDSLDNQKCHILLLTMVVNSNHLNRSQKTSFSRSLDKYDTFGGPNCLLKSTNALKTLSIIICNICWWNTGTHNIMG